MPSESTTWAHLAIFVIPAYTQHQNAVQEFSKLGEDSYGNTSDHGIEY